MKTVTRVMAGMLLVLMAAGCASTSDEQQQEQAQQNPNASSIPWNRPQSWENQGMLGGFNTGPQGSTGH